MWWNDALGLVIILVVVFAVPVGWLFLRRRWLSGRGSVFDCAVCLRPGPRGTGWALGLARYVDDSLEWYRVFSLSLRPRVVLQRDRTQLVTRRAPDDVERLVLFAGNTVVCVRYTEGQGSRDWELAMPEESVTGFLSWLEASPPRGETYSRR